MKRKITGCTGKVCHRSKDAAVVALKKIKNAQLSAYQCRACKGWHLGRSRNAMKINARLDQLLGDPANPSSKEIERLRDTWDHLA